MRAALARHRRDRRLPAVRAGDGGRVRGRARARRRPPGPRQAARHRRRRRRSKGSTSICAARGRSGSPRRGSSSGPPSALDLARVSNHGAVVIERRPPRVAFGEALAPFRRAAFCRRRRPARSGSRPSPKRRSNGAKAVADLFCGAGAFALRLAARARGLRRRLRRRRGRGARSARGGAAHGLKRVEAETRDLFRRPLARRRARRLRRRAVRSAARRRRGPGARDRRERPAARRRDLLQRRRPSPATRAC